MDNSGQLIENVQYFNQVKRKQKLNQNPYDEQNMEESEDISRAHDSSEKQHRNFEVGNVEMFDMANQPVLPKEEDVVNTWFFKVLNELFAPYKGINDQNELLDIIRERYGKLLQADELMQLKTQIEIILNLPQNCAKAIILNKIKDLRTASLMSNKDPEIGVKFEDFDNVNKNFEAYEEMKRMFASIKSQLKLQNDATFTDTLKAVKKTLNKNKQLSKVDKKNKYKPKMNPGNIALRKTKIDIDTVSGTLK